ncbi:methyltransferase family protein [Sphingobium nicotianae]|uniref:Protein-S-isoprenylcysteine methyltransferase n=1 Tax=Sphingobium nicotianae TaxID=2782607 RepID=A0A9X1DFX5_9SPHN|nr:protein-S-isoprenylcysteine methyltransferase [Sphingobium nicotianae]MBT2189154.1 protein-S-isoprenylcysteine methyltransferase [Sphingobium nicotianae]
MSDQPFAPDTRPRSAVSHGVGLAGLAGLALWIVAARTYHMDGPNAGLAAVFACGIPMVLWSVFVDKVHGRASTGIDWANPRPLREVIDGAIVKLTGLWITWGAIALFYMVGGWYMQGDYRYAVSVLTYAAPAVVLLSVPYVLWLDRYLVDPRDGAYAFGQWVIGGASGKPAPGAIANHARAWAVKAFFLAFMLSIVPGNFAGMVDWQADDLWTNPVSLAGFLITLMFAVDVAFATVGYVLTMRPLDAHIRTANPLLAGWLSALMCYPPFAMMGPGGPLFYETDTRAWDYWFSGHPALLWVWGAALVFLTGAYAWATVAFGLRFSNLTHRGILTHGPYRISKHPAYLAKNSFWWLSTLPFLVTTGSVETAARNTIILGLVSGIYYWRARTEEAHLGTDPAYRAYAAWMNRHGPVPRMIALLSGKRPPAAATTMEPAE